MTYEPRRGDIVSLSRAQLVRLTVTAVPPGPGPATYQLTLPINGIDRTFGVEAPFGATLADVMVLLLAELRNLQTLYRFEDDDPPDPETTIIRGPLGAAWTVTVLTANLTTQLIQEAVSTQADGEQIRPIRLLEVESTLAKLRRFATRNRDGLTEERHIVMGRELDSSRLMEFEATRILTVLERET